jgi:16S rRNA (adenine1518-N6/adenine1519-N6)-dimethyltransferase
MKKNADHRDQGVRAKKHLGQHFLKDPSVSARIAGLLAESQDLDILEVGPGTGALTQPLIQRFGNRVHVVEIDPESVTFLQNADWLASERVHTADLLRSTPDDLGLSGAFAVAGNFPYNISSQILFKVLEWRDRVPECVGMFQKEVADRVCAAHGSKTYGILSVLLQTYYTCEYSFTVGPDAFIPPPKVQSGVIRLVRKREKDPEGVEYETLRHLVKAAFGLRRKTLRNALRAGGYDPLTIPDEWLGQRAEQLSPADFVSLARNVKRIT